LREFFPMVTGVVSVFDRARLRGVTSQKGKRIGRHPRRGNFIPMKSKPQTKNK
jgi:hypothetical protein